MVFNLLVHDYNSSFFLYSLPIRIIVFFLHLDSHGYFNTLGVLGVFTESMSLAIPPLRIITC